jgi:hypothetical protein
MSKEIVTRFREKTMSFFYTKNAEGVKTWNKGNLYAVLIGGFVGWLVLTITFGQRLKALLKKVPVVSMLFKTNSAPRRRLATASRRPAPARRRMRK